MIEVLKWIGISLGSLFCLGIILVGLILLFEEITKLYFPVIHKRWFNNYWNGFNVGDRVVIDRYYSKPLITTITGFEFYHSGQLMYIYTNNGIVHKYEINGICKAKDKINHLPEWF